jgi:hypothetical protein
LAVARLVDNTPYHLRQWGIWADLDMGECPQVPDVVDRWTGGIHVRGNCSVLLLRTTTPYYYSVLLLRTEYIFSYLAEQDHFQPCAVVSCPGGGYQ